MSSYYDISSYVVSLYGAKSTVDGGRVVAKIICEGPDSRFVLQISFIRNEDQDQIPPNRTLITGERVSAQIYCLASDYPFYLDLLRNESPVCAYVDLNAALNRITTGTKEPVGDGDIP